MCSAATPSTARTTSCSSVRWMRPTWCGMAWCWCTPPAAPPRWAGCPWSGVGRRGSGASGKPGGTDCPAAGPAHQPNLALLPHPLRPCPCPCAGRRHPGHCAVPHIRGAAEGGAEPARQVGGEPGGWGGQVWLWCSLGGCRQHAPDAASASEQTGPYTAAASAVNLPATVCLPRRWAYLPYSMHMAGPREAIQHMIIRKVKGGAGGSCKLGPCAKHAPSCSQPAHSVGSSIAWTRGCYISLMPRAPPSFTTELRLHPLHHWP